MSDVISILLQTEAFIAVDKPVGISVHNVEAEENLLLRLEKQIKLKRLFPVHRLDKETSGVQILALHEKAAKNLAEEFQSRSVEKIYIGLLRGQIKTEKGIWSEALSDKSEGRKNPAGLAKDRVPCETHFQLLKSSKYFSLCKLDLKTGRQHQIRKHSALAGHAIVGDSRYGDRQYNDRMQEIYKTDRMFLHCESIEIANQKISAPQPAVFESVFN